MQRAFKVICLFERIGKTFERLRDSAVEHNVRAGNGVGRAKHPELKLVACEGEGRSAVAVRRVAQELGKHMHAELHDGLLRRVVGRVGFDRV